MLTNQQAFERISMITQDMALYIKTLTAAEQATVKAFTEAHTSLEVSSKATVARVLFVASNKSDKAFWKFNQSLLQTVATHC